MVYAWGEMASPSGIAEARKAQEAGVMDREEKLSPEEISELKGSSSETSREAQKEISPL